MKIYFAGSITGGRGDKEIYLKIITLLQEYGQVLTEHVGDADLSHMGEMKEKEFIFNRDMDWLRASDVVVAEVTTPSLGVGYEIGLAETLNKKVLCLYRELPEKSLSAMVRGNKLFKIKEYKTIEDLPEIFREFFR
jgi:nucleoside 2-deoxyribosyltransferase